MGSIYSSFSAGLGVFRVVLVIVRGDFGVLGGGYADFLVVVVICGMILGCSFLSFESWLMWLSFVCKFIKKGIFFLDVSFLLLSITLA